MVKVFSPSLYAVPKMVHFGRPAVFFSGVTPPLPGGGWSAPPPALISKSPMLDRRRYLDDWKEYDDDFNEVESQEFLQTKVVER